MAEENVSATLTMAVPAARVFALLADPAAHSAIDGTGWVQEAADRAPLTEVGQIFRMDMYHARHPDGNYQVVNKVQVLDPPRAIGWLTGTETGDGRLEFGGWIRANSTLIILIRLFRVSRIVRQVQFIFVFKGSRAMPLRLS